MGHVIGVNGISSDPKKVEAIVSFEVPENVNAVRRCLGMVNQLGIFTPDLAELSKPLRGNLLHIESSWIWAEPEAKAFEAITNELSSTPKLRYRQMPLHSD